MLVHEDASYESGVRDIEVSSFSSRCKKYIQEDTSLNLQIFLPVWDLES